MECPRCRAVPVILATSSLEQAYDLSGEHEKVVDLATGNLAALPADLVYEHFGTPHRRRSSIAGC